MASERGGVSAEFAVVLPAVLIVLALVIGGVLIAAHRVVLTSAAADLARLEARSDHAMAAARLSELGPGVRIGRSTTGPLHCVTLSRTPAGGPLAFVEVSARACAARSEVGGSG